MCVSDVESQPGNHAHKVKGVLIGCPNLVVITLIAIPTTPSTGTSVALDTGMVSHKVTADETCELWCTLSQRF